MGAIKIKLAVIGCGRVAQHYKKIFDSKKIIGYELVAFCDINTIKAEEFSKHFQVPQFDNLEEMLLKSKPHLLLILSPSGLHFQQAKIALNYGIHTLVEKPMTMLPSEAIELDKISKEKKLMLGVIFQNRLNPAIKRLHQEIQTGRFGKIVTSTIRLRWCRYQDYYEDGWHGTWKNDGGVINQQAIHHVDALNWLMGPIESVVASTENRINQLEAEDTLTACVKFRSGALGTIEATTAARPSDIEASLSVIGEKGVVVINGIALNKIETWDFVEKKPGDALVAKNYSEDVPTGYGLSHYTYLQDTFNALLSGSITPPVSATEALNTSKIIHALYKSDESKCWVSLSEQPLSTRLGK
jgi:predicted dehydrogenase